MKREDSIIQDTSAPDMIPDLTNADSIHLDIINSKSNNDSKTIPITFRYSIEKIKKLKEIARKRAYDEHKDISYVDLIKESIEDKYFQDKE
jgi:hypothetical protein